MNKTKLLRTLVSELRFKRELKGALLNFSGKKKKTKRYDFASSKNTTSDMLLLA